MPRAIQNEIRLHLPSACSVSCRIVMATALVIGIVSSANAQRPYYFGQTNDPTPVDIAFPDNGQLIYFTIPKSYLVFSDDWKGGVRDVISMTILYPSMQPLAGTKKSMNDIDVIQMDLLSHGRKGGNYTIHNVIEWNLKNNWVEVGHIESGFTTYVAKDQVQRWRNHDRFISEYLIPTDHLASPDIYFDCIPWADPRQVGCTGKETFRTHAELDFIFRRIRLAEWAGIRDAVEKCLTSFERR